MKNSIEGYRVKEYNQPVKRYCRTLDLCNDPELIAKYRYLHQQKSIWHEVIEGIKSVGILEMEIYIRDTRLFMIVETPLNFDWEIAMKHLALLPRQQEWEDYTALCQLVKPNSTSAEKWQPLERMFYLYDL